MMLPSLIARSTRRAAGLLVAVAALVSLFQLAIVMQAASYAEARTIEALGQMVPAFIQRWMGASMAVLGSFAGLATFGYFHPIIVLLLSCVSAYVASEPAGDAEAGLVDLLLGRPMARHWLITRSALLLVACPAALVAAMLVTTWIALPLFAPPAAARPGTAQLLLLAAHLVAVSWCFGSLSIAIASGADRRGSAFAAAAIAAVALYLVNVLAASWRPAEIVDVVSPFHYYQAPRVLAGMTHPARDLSILVAAAAMLVGVAYWRFARRDF